MRADEDQTAGRGGGFEHRLRAEIEQIARDLRAEHASIQGTLEVITKAARDVVPGAEDAGITLVTRGRGRGFQSRAATSELPTLIDDLQHRLGDGPCVQAIWNHETVLVTDMTTEGRWPLFAPEAARIGARSMLAFQLYTTENTMGALNLHSSQAGAFDDDAVSIGGTLATHAAIALIASQREEQFRDALASRDIIGQAKGILMHRFSIDADEAFAILARRSQHTNIPLNEVAVNVIEHGPDPLR
ncbi:GAF and ANTAR domain-containing protein [Rhodococcus sp. T2V]|uniref:GAF and ANTAR domain-containing protein n=1 Tax=Rhodococcus sp. T2V TaxID=3034164 RepID=UPI0023E223DE|nr:GAF and ANTAR domain-containing protein [Rhodococcus sp. T2V]MDF3313432.1 GAF and ANTAR domain-containing protein [Rhodococcus sp. T2V]